MEYGILIVGLIVLIVGGDFLVRGAVGFSKKIEHFTIGYWNDCCCFWNFNARIAD